jgi:hypothetical protein
MGTRRLEISDMQVVGSAAWITAVSPRGFSVPVGDSMGVEVDIDTTGLERKTLYTDEIAIASNSEGKTETRVPVTLYIDESSVEEDEADVDLMFSISPNPFKGRINISYEITRRTHVKLVFSDIAGREVVTLVDGFQNPGLKEVNWRTGDISAGVYFCRLVSSEVEVTRKVLLAK